MARPRKHNPPQPESQRVAAWRKRQMQEKQYRNVSFLASPEEYDLIEASRSRYGLTTKELMLYYLSGRYLSESLEPEGDQGENELRDESQDEPESTGPNQTKRKQRDLEDQRQHGTIFNFPHRQEYLLVSFYLNLDLLPGLFPFEIEPIRDFASYREALQYYLLRRDRLPPARQLVLMRRAGAAEIGWEPPEDGWYHIRLRLNQIYPQLAEQRFDSDPTDYRAEYEQMAAEYADEGG
ncbi:MAG: hypothetical protein ACAI44_36670 [Candidatus Sericytochromatia bacterium]